MLLKVKLCLAVCSRYPSTVLRELDLLLPKVPRPILAEELKNDAIRSPVYIETEYLLFSIAAIKGKTK